MVEKGCIILEGGKTEESKAVISYIPKIEMEFSYKKYVEFSEYPVFDL